MAQRNDTGMFPREVMNRFPLLPLEEEGRLNDMPLRENFIERVFAYYRWTEMLENYRTADAWCISTPPPNSRSWPTARSITPRWAASSPMRASEALGGTSEYGAQLMEGLSVMDTRGKHVNVLQHLMGYLKNHLSSDREAGAVSI